jgi:hypothetical protein
MDQRSGLQWVAGDNTPPKVYITRVINYGNLEEWRALKHQYSPEAIQDALTNPLPGQWTKHGKAFAEIMFDVTLPNDVLNTYGR